MRSLRASGVAFVAALLCGSTFAQSPVPGVDAYPDQFTFCTAPGPVPSGESARVALEVPRPRNVEIVVSNLRPIKTAPIVIKGVRLSSVGIGDAPPKPGFGVGPGTGEISPRIISVQNTAASNPQRDTSGFSATTDCFDRFGNALPIGGEGGACRIYLTFKPIATAHSRMLQIASDDPLRPLITIPLMVYNAANCTQPPERFPARRVTLGDFFPVGPVPGGADTPPAQAIITADCRCGVTCRDRQLSSAHVQCTSAENDSCRACCGSFARASCDAGVSSYGFSVW